LYIELCKATFGCSRVPPYFNDAKLKKIIVKWGITNFRKVHKIIGWHYAFIEFNTDADMRAALPLFDGKVLKGNPVGSQKIAQVFFCTSSCLAGACLATEQMTATQKKGHQQLQASSLGSVLPSKHDAPTVLKEVDDLYDAPEKRGRDDETNAGERDPDDGAADEQGDQGPSSGASVRRADAGRKKGGKAREGNDVGALLKCAADVTAPLRRSV